MKQKVGKLGKPQVKRRQVVPNRGASKPAQRNKLLKLSARYALDDVASCRCDGGGGGGGIIRNSVVELYTRQLEVDGVGNGSAMGGET